MSLIPLPEWAPNIHPIIVHFPIALLVVAVIFDSVSLFLKQRSGLYSASVALFVSGAVAALTAFFTGRIAADSVTVSTLAQATLTDHADWAELTVWFFGIYALIRLAIVWYERKNNNLVSRTVDRLIFVIGIAGLYLLVQTGDNGARMVFKYAVGVQTQIEEVVESDEETDADDHDHTEAEDHDLAVVKDIGLDVTGDGSWNWSPGSGARRVLGASFKFVSGDPEDVEIIEEDSNMSVRINEPFFFFLDRSLGSIESEAVLNIDDFDGAVRLVHHLQDSENFDFLALEEGMIRQGRTINGTDEIFDEKPLQATGWLRLRAVGDGSHFRGYIGAELLVHGHADELPAGSVGLSLEGTGVVKLRSIGVQVLR